MEHDSDGLGKFKFMQPVLVRRLIDNEEYKPTDGPASKIPALLGQVLVKGDGDGIVNTAKAKM
jgi:hypothetical protein